MSLCELKINNEILTEVLKEKIKRHNPSFEKIIGNHFEKQFDLFIINYKDIKGRTLGYMINTYDLAHKLKVFFAKKNYLISELLEYVLIIKNEKVLKRIDNDFYETDDDLNWNIEFDIRSVFKATEWIINESK